MIDSNSLTNYLIFFAHKKEANALLFQSPLKFKQNSINIYSTQLEDKIISVIICGIGKKRLYACLKNIKLHREDIIIKAGTCALVDSSLKIKHAYYPSFVSDGEKKINLDKIDDFTLIDKGLLTVDGVFTAGSRTIIPVDNVAFIDMEAFYLMDYFKDNRKIAIVAPSDYGNKQTDADFKKNLAECSEKLKTAVCDFLKLIKY